jgi:hypothetical protein
MGNQQGSSQQASWNSKPSCPRCGRHGDVRHAVALDNDGYSRASSGGYIGSMTGYCFFTANGSTYLCENRH